jgi:hypothetical protein
VRRTWRFVLEWVPGGEDQLKDIEKDDGKQWTTDFMPPWWEPEHPRQLDHQPMFEPSRSSASPMPESWPDITITGLNSMLLPLPLLAPFSEHSAAASIFPTGYYCIACGRINVQRFLRHRFCEGAVCNSRTDAQGETGWAVSAFSISKRNRSATVFPDDIWAAPTTIEPAIAFGDGARLFHYRLDVGDSGSSDPGNAGAHSVRHVFNGNEECLQGDASELFETLQRDVRLERSIGTSVFATPQIELDDPALERGIWRSIWYRQAAEIVENALRTYCRDLGPLKVWALRVSAWISDGKVRIAPPPPPSCLEGVAHGQSLRTHVRCSCRTFKRSVRAASTSSCSASVPTSL